MLTLEQRLLLERCETLEEALDLALRLDIPVGDARAYFRWFEIGRTILPSNDCSTDKKHGNAIPIYPRYGNINED